MSAARVASRCRPPPAARRLRPSAGTGMVRACHRIRCPRPTSPGSPSRSDAKGLVRLALHVATIAAAGVVHAAALETAWMLPAAWVYGTCLAFLFAPLHETVHYTAFRSRGLNRAVSVACGWLLVLPPRFFPRLPPRASPLHAGSGARPRARRRARFARGASTSGGSAAPSTGRDSSAGSRGSRRDG